MPNIIVFHTAWMAKYDGDDDTLFAGGFRYPSEHGYGHEMLNFRDIDGFCYGHVPQLRKLHLDKYYADVGKAEPLDNAVVVWTAPHPEKGMGRAIVGVWRNSTVYSDRQKPSGRLARRRTIRDLVASYICEAKAEDCILLPPEARPIFVSTGEKPGGGPWPGTSSVFYPRLGSAAYKRLSSLIDELEPADAGKPARKKSQWQIDVERRFAIEEAAIAAVVKNLVRQGFKVTPRETENLGFDLEAVRGSEILHVEVKGRSGSDVCADLSPNEFECLKRYERERNPKAHYRIAIVTDALLNPMITEFAFVGEDGWLTRDRSQRLDFKDRVAARVSAVEA